MGKGIIILMVMMLVLPSIHALGVAVPYMANNVLDINDKEDTANVTFQIQNSGSSSKVVIFKVNANSNMIISGGSFYEAQYTLVAGEAKNIALTFGSNTIGRYKIEYSLSESCGSSGGICFDTSISNSFFIEVEQSTPTWYTTFNQDYTDYTLSADSFDNMVAVTGLVVTSKNSKIIVDFGSSAVDMRGFNESNIQIGDKRILLNKSSFANKNPRFTFYDILGQDYSVSRNGTNCNMDCNSYSYSSGSRRLTFTSKGVGDYQVSYTLPTSPPSSGGGSSGGGSSGGGLISKKNTTNTTNTTVTPPVVNTPPVVTPPPVVVPPVEKPVNTNPAPVVALNRSADIDKAEKKPIEGKDLLTGITLLGGITWVFGIGLLIYYRRISK